MRPVECGDRPQVIEILSGIEFPDEILGRIRVAGVAEYLARDGIRRGLGLARQIHGEIGDLVTRVGEAAAGLRGMVGADAGVLVGLERAIRLLDQGMELLDARRPELVGGQQARGEEVELRRRTPGSDR